MLRRLLCLFVPLLAAVTPAAQRASVEPTKYPFLWRIVGDQPSYLYGTIHLPDQRIVALPKAVQDGIAACDVLYTELEFDVAVQKRLQTATVLPDKQTLQGVLPKATYQGVVDYLDSKKVPKVVFDGLANSQPWTLLAVLPMLDDLRMLMSGDPLDARIAREAKRLGKTTAALETPEEQVAVFAQFSHAEVAQMLDATIAMLRKFDQEGRKPIQELIDVYLSGDLAALQTLMDDMQGLEHLQDLERRLRKSLLDDRNQLMVERLLAHRKAAPDKVHFFAVGAAHYGGEQGILALLAKAGVKVERVGGEPPAFVHKAATPAKQPAEAERGRAPVRSGKGQSE